MQRFKYANDGAAEGRKTPELEEGETVEFQASGARVVLGRDNLGTGRLLITTENLLWLNDSADVDSLRIEYPHIVWHAVCRDTSSYPDPCLYCQLDEVDSDAELAAGGEVDEDAAAEATANSEFRIVLADDTQLTPLFDAVAHCSALHPDEADEDDEEGGYSALGPDSMFTTAHGQMDLASIMAGLQVYDPFADAGAAAEDAEAAADGEADGEADATEEPAAADGATITITPVLSEEALRAQQFAQLEMGMWAAMARDVAARQGDNAPPSGEPPKNNGPHA